MEFQLEKNVSLAPLTTLQVGGPAAQLATVRSVEEVKAAGRFAQQTDQPLCVLAGGSNILFSDDGFAGVVLKNEITGITIREEMDQVYVRCGAGEVFDDLIKKTVENGWWGLENLSAIPGTVGAAPIQNVGAYGVEVSSLITKVEAISLSSQTQKTFSATECLFGYRDSAFKTAAGRDWLVTHVEFVLSKTPQPNISYADIAFLKDSPGLKQSDIREAIEVVRSQKFPNWKKVGTAGSFFKNPIISNQVYRKLAAKYPELPQYPVSKDTVKIPLGWVLDKVCNVKGWCLGEVCLFEKQALVLVNHGTSAAAVLDCVAAVEQTVFEKTGIVIEPEVRIVQTENYPHF